MGAGPQEPFEKRVRRIERKHERIQAHGATAKLQKDGLIEMQPRRGGPGRRLPVMWLVYVLVALFGFKVFLYTYLGPEEYALRLMNIDAETTTGRMGAAVLQPDPATLYLYDMIGQLRG